MGCDVHSMVEVKQDRWESDRQWSVPGLPWIIGAPSTRWVEMEDEIFPLASWRGEGFGKIPLDDRNYTLFALLADVRNGRGFAGVKTGDRIQPLAEPRGVPTDASYAWLAVVDGWGPDMHSHTWFTLAELLDHPLFNQRLVRTGAISALEYERIKREGGMPQSWSGGVGGPGIRTVSVDEYEAGERGTPYTQEEVDRMRVAWRESAAKRGESIEDVDKRLDDHIAEGRTYVQYVWEDSLPDAITELTDAIEALKRWAEDRPPKGKTNHKGEPVDDEPGWYGHGTIPHENIRIVMGFDN